MNRKIVINIVNLGSDVLLILLFNRLFFFLRSVIVGAHADLPERLGVLAVE